jgi:organic hydroperoxide reductase OsmC/OhrA
MESEHSYRVIAWWSAGKAGLAKSDSAPNAIHFTAPTQFGGCEGRWSPEDLLLAAVAGCYTTTFRALAEYSKFAYTDLEVETQGVIRKVESGYQFDGIVIRPKVTIASEYDQPRAWLLLEKAKRLCLVSRTLSVAQTFEPQVRVAARRELGQALPVG